MIFISSDKLHRSCAPLFLNDNQEFIWGDDLKNGLKEIDIHYSSYPESVKEKGIFSISIWFLILKKILILKKNLILMM